MLWHRPEEYNLERTPPTGAAILMTGATSVAHRATCQEMDSFGLRLERSEVTGAESPI